MSEHMPSLQAAALSLHFDDKLVALLGMEEAAKHPWLALGAAKALQACLQNNFSAQDKLRDSGDISRLVCTLLATWLLFCPSLALSSGLYEFMRNGLAKITVLVGSFAFA